MKAVNLVPTEERRGAGGAAGRTGGAAYVLVGALTLVVGMTAAYATTTKSVNDRKAELTSVERQAAATEAQAAALAPYTAFAGIRASRVATVTSIAASRFDWAHAMHELGRTLPHNITLTSLNGTVSTQSSAGGGGGVSLRAAYDVPAIELQGCAPGQGAIPPMLASLRQVDGVRRVALQQSVSGASAAPAGGTGTGGRQRTANCARSFSAVIFYDPKPQPSAPAPAAATATPGTTPVAATTPTGGAK
jgi:Tfp pilus assembly protein PilN